MSDKKPMTKQELADEIMGIIQKAREEVNYPRSLDDDLETYLTAINEIETLCHFEASEEISDEERIRQLVREEFEKRTCIQCCNVVGNTIDGRCKPCHDFYSMIAPLCTRKV